MLDALAFELDRGSAVALHRQLQERMRAEILSGALRPGTRLPSSRALSQSLGVARNTVLNAFEQLASDGFLEGLHGSGTYVARNLPLDMAEILRPTSGASYPADAHAIGATRAMSFLEVPVSFRIAQRPVPFRMNYPAIDAFPVRLWATLTARLYRRLAADPRRELLGEGDAQGYLPLRQAIADHAALARGVRCTADNIIVFAGAQQALDVAVRVLLDVGDEAWLEDPSYPGARSALAAAGAQVRPVPVDAQGLVVAEGERCSPRARLVYVCPSKQFPLGVTMSLSRRFQLLDWANRSGAWIIEDDYDSEYRFDGRPVAALQGLDRGGRVIYLGTFSKVIFPSLRLGFAIVPDALVDAFIGGRAIAGRHSPVLEQALLAAFMREGHFARHVRRMRKLYIERQAALLDTVHRHLGDTLAIRPTEAGLQLVAWLPHHLDDAKIARAGAAAGLELAPLSRFAITRPLPPGLLLGFGAFSREQIDEGVRRLRNVLRGAGLSAALAREARSPASSRSHVHRSGAGGARRVRAA
ncbi:PLP-dependent aminotransferase family protein [Reyranella sp.]|uniref:MocR-like pyridoxine biosynthesis transcription factor PdxR n=1 Tax=Reyranella sp. TaxID=1929291 RepID=UPI002F934079